MKYGLLGARLDYSYSKDIHEQYLEIDNYELNALDENAFRTFMTNKDFKGVNITNPYKKIAMEYCDEIDTKAQRIGCINTVINQCNRLIGYNTDYYGMKYLVETLNINLSKCTVAILGTGATSNTAEVVAQDLEAFKIIKVSRNETNGITYKSFEKLYKDEPIFIINTTPVGTYPNIDDTPINLKKFNNIYGVIDVVYNPLRSHLVQQAKELNIPAEGGLYMLIVQAIKANELFLGKKVYVSVQDIYKKIVNSKENIVLIGMPGSGKTTIANKLESKINRTCYHVDEAIEQTAQMSCKEIFETLGEDKFRELETNITKNYALLSSTIIDTGGGIVLNKENIFRLKQNGRIFFIFRDTDLLTPTTDRPTAFSKTMIKKTWEKRRELYYCSADVILFNDKDPIEDIVRIIYEAFSN